ncbi:hypothetical protein [Novipirellula aureliae]|nr:hypothetical protein [Novipirellula aureliae]
MPATTESLPDSTNNPYKSSVLSDSQPVSRSSGTEVGRILRYTAALLGGMATASLAAAIAFCLTIIVLTDPLSRLLGLGSVFDGFLLFGNPLLAAISGLLGGVAGGLTIDEPRQRSRNISLVTCSLPSLPLLFVGISEPGELLFSLVLALLLFASAGPSVLVTLSLLGFVNVSRRRPPHMNRDTLLHWIKERHSAGRSMKFSDVCLENRDMALAVKRTFGSWRNALREAEADDQPAT